MSGLHVLAAARSLPCHSIGGMQSIAWDVLTGLARLGHRVTVLTTDVPGRKTMFEDSGVTVVPLPEARSEKYSMQWWRQSRAYAEERFGRGVDAVLSISTAAAGLIPLKRSVMNVPFIYQVHGSSWGEALSKWRSARPAQWLRSARNLYWMFRDAAIYRAFDQMVFVGDSLMREFESPPMRWMARGIAKTVIANGIDTERFHFDAAARAAVRKRFGWGEHDRGVAFAARLHPQKGAAQLLEALRILRARDPDFKLLLVGGGPEEETLRKLVRELKLARTVAFAGTVARKDVPAMLSAGDVFAFPTLRREGLPLNVLEALSVGLPCVCPDDLNGMFPQDMPITYANPRNPRSLADAIHRVALRAPPQRCLLPTRYWLRNCVNEYGALLERLVRGQECSASRAH